MTFFYPYKDQNKLDSLFLEYIDNIHSLSNYEEAIISFGVSLHDMHSIVKKNDQYILPVSSKTLGINFEILYDSLLIVEYVHNTNSPFIEGDTIVAINSKNPLAFLVDKYSQRKISKFSKWINIYTPFKTITISRKSKLINIEYNKNMLISQKEWATKNYYRNHKVLYNKNTYYFIDFGKRISKKTLIDLKKSNFTQDTIIIDARGSKNINTSPVIMRLKNNDFIYYNYEVNNDLNFSIVDSFIVSPFKKNKNNKFIIILINEFTQSQSEVNVLDLIYNEEILVLGKYSANALGSVFIDKYLNLPYSLKFRTTHNGFVKLGNKVNNLGLIPDIFMSDYIIDNYRFNKTTTLK